MSFTWFQMGHPRFEIKKLFEWVITDDQRWNRIRSGCTMYDITYWYILYMSNMLTHHQLEQRIVDCISTALKTGSGLTSQTPKSILKADGTDPGNGVQPIIIVIEDIEPQNTGSRCLGKAFQNWSNVKWVGPRWNGIKHREFQRQDSAPNTSEKPPDPTPEKRVSLESASGPSIRVALIQGSITWKSFIHVYSIRDAFGIWTGWDSPRIRIGYAGVCCRNWILFISWESLCWLLGLQGLGSKSCHGEATHGSARQCDGCRSDLHVPALDDSDEMVLAPIKFTPGSSRVIQGHLGSSRIQVTKVGGQRWSKCYHFPISSSKKNS